MTKEKKCEHFNMRSRIDVNQEIQFLEREMFIIQQDALRPGYTVDLEKASGIYKERIAALNWVCGHDWPEAEPQRRTKVW